MKQAVPQRVGSIGSPDASVHAGAPADAASEIALLERLRAGEEAAFEELTASAAGRMLSIARKMMPCDADAEEAVQDAFLAAFRAMDRFDGRAKLTTWLHQITVNACRMKLRAKRRRPERRIEDLLPTFLPDGHQTRPALPWRAADAPALESSELQSLVREKMQELPEQYRTVLILRDVEGLNTDEAATALGVTLDTIKTRLHRARQALKTLLDPYFIEQSQSPSSLR